MTRRMLTATLVGAVALMIVPGIATGHHEPGHGQPVPKEVIVANDSSAPVPTEINGSVQVEQSGVPWEVVIPTDDPVPVNPRPRQPFQYLFGSGGSKNCVDIPIPEGRTLEVQSVSVSAGVNGESGEPHIGLRLFGPGGPAGFFVPAGAIEMFQGGLEDPTGITAWHGSLTGLTLFAGEINGETLPLAVCPGAIGLYDFQGTVSGRLE